jgi:hypothetical protein
MRWIGSNSCWRMDTGSLRVSSPRSRCARCLCEAAQTGGSGEVAQAARGFGFAGTGRAKTALGEIVSTGFELEEAICRIIWFNVFSAERIGLHSTAVSASSLLLIFSSRACSRPVVTVRLACIIVTSRACAGSPIVFWREDWHRLTDAYMCMR